MTYGTSPHRRDTVRNAAEARRMSKNMRAVMKQLDEFGDIDPLPTTGSVVSWRMSYDYHGKVYDFAAVKAGDKRWYMTGKATTGFTWDEMVEFWVTYNVSPEDIVSAVGWDTMMELLADRAIMEAIK